MGQSENRSMAQMGGGQASPVDLNLLQKLFQQQQVSGNGQRNKMGGQPPAPMASTAQMPPPVSPAGPENPDAEMVRLARARENINQVSQNSQIDPRAALGRQIGNIGQGIFERIAASHQPPPLSSPTLPPVQTRPMQNMPGAPLENRPARRPMRPTNNA